MSGFNSPLPFLGASKPPSSKGFRSVNPALAVTYLPDEEDVTYGFRAMPPFMFMGATAQPVVERPKSPWNGLREEILRDDEKVLMAFVEQFMEMI